MSLRCVVHLWEATRVLLADVRYPAENAEVIHSFVVLTHATVVAKKAYRSCSVLISFPILY